MFLTGDVSFCSLGFKLNANAFPRYISRPLLANKIDIFMVARKPNHNMLKLGCKVYSMDVVILTDNKGWMDY